MSTLQKVAAAVLIVWLAAAGYGLWVTNESGATPVRALKASGTAAAPASALPLIDQNTYLTARRLAHLAATPEEQSLAQAAVQTADHELDLAFTAALWQLEAHPPPLTAEASQIQARLLQAQKVLASDTENVRKLTAALAQATDPDKAAIQDRLDLAQSRMELAQDEVQEANDDLLQAGGNLHQRIQMMQQEHEATEHSAPDTPAAATAGALGSLRGMVGLMRQWLSLRDKQRWLLEAQQHAAASAAQLESERQQIAANLAASKARIPELATRGARAPGAPAASPAAPSAAAGSLQAPTGAVPPPADAPASVLGLTRQIAAEQHRLTLRDQRISARRRLADVYAQWQAVVASQMRAV